MRLKTRRLEREDGARYNDPDIEAGRPKFNDTYMLQSVAWAASEESLAIATPGPAALCLDACGDTLRTCVVTETFSAAAVAGHATGARSVLLQMPPSRLRRKY
jgi:hypothetical protein